MKLQSIFKGLQILIYFIIVNKKCMKICLRRRKCFNFLFILLVSILNFIILDDQETALFMRMHIFIYTCIYLDTNIDFRLRNERLYKYY